MSLTYQNRNVLEFYKKLPFNTYSNNKAAIKSIKKKNPINIYPPLKDIIINKEDFNILDVGCGVGWFVNSLSFFFKKIQVTGVDYNQVAINFANNIKEKMKLKSSFLKQDLFDMNFNKKFNLVTSIGVLHHTNNCLEGIKKLLALSPNYILLGLYHKHGRKPFLDHFDNLKIKYSSLNTSQKETKLFEEYKKLDKRESNVLHLKSWFKDQVLHPHETQQTFKEILPVFLNKNYEIFKTSLNKFEYIKDYKNIIDAEKDWYEYGLNKLKRKEYYPGFFIVVAKKNNY